MLDNRQKADPDPPEVPAEAPSPDADAGTPLIEGPSEVPVAICKLCSGLVHSALAEGTREGTLTCEHCGFPYVYYRR